LREVADLTPADRVVLLGEETEVIAQTEKPLEQPPGLGDTTGHDVGIYEPERAGEEGAFARGGTNSSSSGTARRPRS
jgi:hypothetical protein